MATRSPSDLLYVIRMQQQENENATVEIDHWQDAQKKIIAHFNAADASNASAATDDGVPFEPGWKELASNLLGDQLQPPVNCESKQKVLGNIQKMFQDNNPANEALYKNTSVSDIANMVSKASESRARRIQLQSQANVLSVRKKHKSSVKAFIAYLTTAGWGFSNNMMNLTLYIDAYDEWAAHKTKQSKQLLFNLFSLLHADICADYVADVAGRNIKADTVQGIVAPLKGLCNSLGLTGDFNEINRVVDGIMQVHPIHCNMACMLRLIRVPLQVVDYGGNPFQGGAVQQVIKNQKRQKIKAGEKPRK
jgi:hypothetical protein